MNNQNHPKKGQSCKVDPIKNVEDISRIKAELLDKGCTRNLLLFVLGINNGLRMGDLLKLRVRDVQWLDVGEELTLIEQKTKEENILVINHEVFTILHRHINSHKLSGIQYLFQSRKGNNCPLTVSSVHRMIGKWTRGLEGNFGTHSLRKTFGYQQRVQHGVSIYVLKERFKHKNIDVTIRYTGVDEYTRDNVADILMNGI